MAKKFTLMMLILLLFGAASFSQTASLAPAVTASPGQNITIPLNVTGFTGIGSITFFIRFKPSVMTFTGISNPSQGVQFQSYVTDSSLNIVWAGYPYVNFPDNVPLVDLNFTYYGMTTSPLNFLGNCEVTQGLNIIYPAYTNGSVSMLVQSQTATLSPVTATTGGNVSVPIIYQNMPASIGAVTQKIHYDPTKLNFISVVGSGNLAIGTNYSADISNGIITITWTNNGGTNINYPNEFLLNFVYTGSTVTNVDFVAGCIISTPPPVSNVAVTYYGGTVSLNNSPAATAVLGSITNANQGQDYDIPLTLAGFPATGAPSGPTQAFTLTLPFDNAKLSYIGIESPVPSGLVVSQASGTLTLAWSNPSATNINGVFLNMKFKYNGIGTAHINFGNGCVFNTYDPILGVGTVQVAYTNSTITPGTATANATIGFVPGTAGSNVLVPVNFSGLPVPPVGMGAVTLYITYNNNALTFVDAQNNTYGANVYLNGATHTITIAWAASQATNINGKFLDLRFSYNGGGGGGCGAAVSFADGCQLADINANIVQANWINGGVNLRWTVSGHLYYNNTTLSNLPLPGATVYIKDGPEPVPPAIIPVPNIIATATTDANGAYSVNVPNGTYYLYAANTAAWAGVGPPDLTNLVRYLNNLHPNTLDNNPLRIRAADINQDGLVTILDLTPLTRRINNLIPNPTYKAPDWLFQNPIILINCANTTGSDFLGICSGDVNGSYPNAFSK